MRWHSMPTACRRLAAFAAAASPGLVGVEGEAHAFDLRGADRLEEFVGEVLGAEGAGRRLHAVADEREGVEDRLAQDDFAVLLSASALKMPASGRAR